MEHKCGSCDYVTFSSDLLRSHVRIMHENRAQAGWRFHMLRRPAFGLFLGYFFILSRRCHSSGKFTV